MKVNLNTVMFNEDGDPLTEKKVIGEGEDKKTIEITLTLAHIVKRALLVPVREDSIPAKVEKYELWLRTAGEDKVEFSAEDITLIKKCIGEAFTQIVVGQAYRLLEDKETGITKSEGEE